MLVGVIEPSDSPDFYTDKIKNRCFLCRFWFKNSYRHYETYGNACSACCGRIMRVKNVKTKYRRRLSQDDCSFYLALRRQWVLENYLDRPPEERPEGFTPAPPPVET